MFDELSNVTKQQKKVSRITVNSPPPNLEKPSLPDRPKNINDIKKILEIKNSTKDGSDRNIELMKSTFLRRSSKETNAKVTTEKYLSLSLLMFNFYFQFGRLSADMSTHELVREDIKNIFQDLTEEWTTTSSLVFWFFY